jgi:hypothetical protein
MKNKRTMTIPNERTIKVGESEKAIIPGQVIPWKWNAGGTIQYKNLIATSNGFLDAGGESNEKQYLEWLNDVQ